MRMAGWSPIDQEWSERRLQTGQCYLMDNSSQQQSSYLGGHRSLKVPAAGGQGWCWIGPVGGWMYWAGPCARCGQLATQHLPLPHSPIGCRSLPDLGTPRVPQRGFVGSAQLGQKALVVVSQRAVGLHVGDGPLLRLPSQSGHQEGHSLGFTREAGSLKDHEPVHLHQEPRQLAGVSRKRFRQ